jgi:hypothetical protein
MELTKDSIANKARFTAFSADKFTIHKLYKGNPAYSGPINPRHTNLVFYDKALPYPEQDDDAHICIVGSKWARYAQTGIILDNPNPRCPGLTYMTQKPADFVPCGGYYFIADYSESLYHKARLVAYFGNGKPVIKGWDAVFSHIIDDCFLVSVFVSDKRNPENGCADAKLCIFYLGDLEPFHNMGPQPGYQAPGFSTTCVLVNTVPLKYTQNRYSRGSPCWKWLGHGETLLCIEDGKLTTHTIDIFSDNGDVTSRTASSTHITLLSNVSFNDDGTKLFIQDDIRRHNHDIYFDVFDVADEACIAVCRTVLAFDLPELMQCALPNPADYATNWVIDDTVALNVNSEDKHYHLSLHLTADGTRVADLKTHFDLESGIIVYFTYKNVTPGRHYICIGSCAYKSNYIYTVDTTENAIYSYQLSSNIGSHLLTVFNCPVFGDGTIFIGGFCNPRSYYHNESITYAVRPTMVVDAIKTAPIPDELIRLTMSYLNV